jgi:RsmE family RNA methyltransferase
VNLLLLQDDDFLSDGTVRLTGRRLVHARDVLACTEGSELRVGRSGGLIGRGRVLSISETELSMEVQLEAPPPRRPGVDLLLAVPRPKALKRVLACAAAVGVDRLVLVNSCRVERSYFDSPVLSPASISEHLRLGLEQARDTHMPEVHVRRRFRPFVEDELDGMFGSSTRSVLHPDDRHTEGFAGGPGIGERVLLAIGPEGGFVPFEIDLLREKGFVPCSLGPRVHRVEVVLPYALGWLAGQRAPKASR